MPAPHSLHLTPGIIALFYLEVHKIHQFRDLRLKDLHGFLINFNSVRLFVTFHLEVNKHDRERLQPREREELLEKGRSEVGCGVTGQESLEAMRPGLSGVGCGQWGWGGVWLGPAPVGWPESSFSRCTA